MFFLSLIEERDRELKNDNFDEECKMTKEIMENTVKLKERQKEKDEKGKMVRFLKDSTYSKSLENEIEILMNKIEKNDGKSYNLKEIIKTKEVLIKNQNEKILQLSNLYNDNDEAYEDLKRKYELRFNDFINKKMEHESCIAELGECEENISFINDKIKRAKNESDKIAELNKDSFKVINFNKMTQKRKNSEIKHCNSDPGISMRNPKLHLTGLHHSGSVINDSHDIENYSFNFGGQIYSIRFCQQHNYIAVGGADKCVHIVDSTSRKIIRTTNNSKNGIIAVSYSPNGDRLAAASYGKTLFLYDNTCSTLINEYSLHEDKINDCLFLSDSNIITGGGDSILRNFDLQKGRTKSWIKTDSIPSSLCTQKNSMSVIAGFNNGHVRWWDGGTNYFTFDINTERKKVYQVISTNDNGQIIAICSNSLALIDNRMPNRVLKYTNYNGFSDHMRACVCKNKLYIGGTEGRIRLFDVDTLAEENPINSNIRSKIFAIGSHPISGKLATGDELGNLTVW